MIDYLFRNKIVLFDPPITPGEAIDFLKKIKAAFKLEKNEKPIKQADKVIIEIEKDEDVDQYIFWFRFWITKNGDYRITYYGGEWDFEDGDTLSDVHESLNEYIYGKNYTLIDKDDVLGISDLPSVEDIFNKLNESYGDSYSIPLNIEDWRRKVIIFDRNASEEDVKKVYDFLVSLGIKGFGPVPDDYLDEMYDFLGEYGHLYFKIYKVQKNYRINYGWDSDDYSAVSSKDVFSYLDVLHLIDALKNNVSGIIDNLFENTEISKTPKKGDFLLCHTPVVMDDTGEFCAIKGKFYPIEEVWEYRQELKLIGECGEHYFSLQGRDSYTTWFDLVTSEEKNKMSDIIGDIFNEL